MSFFTKCLKEERLEVSYFSAIFSLFSAFSAAGAIFNDEWITIRNDDLILSGSSANSSSLYPLQLKLIPLCSQLGASVFWNLVSTENRMLLNKTLQINNSEFHNKHGGIHSNCISPVVAFLLYCAVSLCFVIILISICAAALQLLLPSPKFLEWLRKCVILEFCNVFIMFIVCFLVWGAKHKIEANYVPKINIDVCVGNGMFYIICCGAFSSIAAFFSLYQNKLANRSRRAENQRFICTRALRSWRDHVENNRLTSSVNCPTELERYLLGASSDRQSFNNLKQQQRSDTMSSTMTILPSNEIADNQ